MEGEMEGSSPSKEEEQIPANGYQLSALYDIQVFGDTEIDSRFEGNAVESSSIGNIGNEGARAGMEMVRWDGKVRDEGDGSTHCSRTGPFSVLDYTSAFTTNQVFGTEDEMRQWITSTAKQHGFVVIVMGSEKAPKNRRPRMRFSCERSGKYRPYVSKAKDKGGNVNKMNGKNLPRITSSKKCECPLELRGVKGLEGWTVTVVNGSHNHNPAKQLDGNYGFRVVSMCWSGSQHGWSESRAKLVGEVESNLDLYEKVTGTKGGPNCYVKDWHGLIIISMYPWTSG